MAPAALLEERIACTRRLMIHSAEGDIMRAEVPTYDALVKHADRFGPESVCETAVELGYGLDFITRLVARCDTISRDRYAREHGGRTGGWPKPKADAESRAKKLLDWKEPEPEPVP